jgi:hypothetical protein
MPLGPLTSIVDGDKIRSDTIRYDNVSQVGRYIDQGNHAITTKKLYPTSAMNRLRGDNIFSTGSTAQAKCERQSTATFTLTPERRSISTEASGKKTRPTI